MKQQWALFFILLATTAWAENFEVSGTIGERHGRAVITTDNGKRLYIFSQRPEVTAQLAKLTSGDFVMASGHSTNSAFEVSEVLFVGLKGLLGIWSDSDNSVVSIRNFQELKVYRPRFVRDVVTQDIQYNLAPETGPGWTLLMLVEGRPVVGTLQLNGDSVMVEYPSHEGNILPRQLTRLKIKKPLSAQPAKL